MSSSCVLQAEALLYQYGQEHILPFLGKLTGEEQSNLAEQILQVDFEQLARTFRNRNAANELNAGAVLPARCYDWNTLAAKDRDLYERHGWHLLRSGKVGVIVVAGGQGSRLGHRGPKGTIDIGLPSHKSLFQLQAERLLNLSRRAGKYIPWYVMTSPDNSRETEAFFQAHDYFGYPAEDCIFFEQNTMPAIDREGKLILSSHAHLCLAPSGNGECFSSLKRSGALADMKKRGLSRLFYYNVDNALIKAADPAFIGMADLHNHPVATKVIEKTDPDEKVGMVCSIDGRPAVLEYTEFPEALLHARNSDGKLSYGLGNTSIHVFSYDFINRHSDSDLPYHAALKKIDCIDSGGHPITPQTPNAYKLERFIFDFFPLAEDMTVLKVKREEEFAPVKNKDGADSPNSARELVLRLHRKWLDDAGIAIVESKGHSPEISPLLSYSGEGLDAAGISTGLDTES